MVLTCPLIWSLTLAGASVSPQHPFTWYKNGSAQLISEEPRMQLRESALWILQAMREDSGTYICRVRWAPGVRAGGLQAGGCLPCFQQWPRFQTLVHRRESRHEAFQSLEVLLASSSSSSSSLGSLFSASPFLRAGPHGPLLPCCSLLTVSSPWTHLCVPGVSIRLHRGLLHCVMIQKTDLESRAGFQSWVGC